jgi:hypothetical protein
MPQKGKAWGQSEKTSDERYPLNINGIAQSDLKKGRPRKDLKKANRSIWWQTS